MSVATSTFNADGFLSESVDKSIKVKVEQPIKESTKLNVTH